MTEIDFATAMRDVIDAATPDGPYVASALAAQIVARLNADNPGLLDGWLHAQAVSFIANAITARDRSARGRAVHQARVRRFNAAEAALLVGDPEPLHELLMEARFVVDEAFTRKRLGSMTRDDLDYVAERYEVTAADARFKAALMRGIAARIGDRTVEEVYSEDDLARMFSGLE